MPTERPGTLTKGRIYLDYLFSRELRGATVQASLDLIKHKIPDSSIPFSPKDLLKSLTAQDGSHAMYDLDSKRWIDWPIIRESPSAEDELKYEKSLSAYINSIAGHVSSSVGSEDAQRRRWLNTDPENMHEAVDIGLEWKPTFQAVERSTDQRDDDLGQAFRWRAVRVLFVARSHATLCSDLELSSQLANGARHSICDRGDRRFVLGVTLDGTEMTLSVFNRSGYITSDKFCVHQNPEYFLRVAVGVLFLDRIHLGFDPTISLIKSEIEVNLKVYKILSELYQENTLRGRGTACWKVERDGEIFITKDTWINTKHEDREGEILRLADGLHGVVRLKDEEQVKIDGKPDSTEGDLNFVKNRRPEIRQHVRKVFTPFGDPLVSFRNKRELLSAFIDVVDAHELLCQNNILHRDVSLGNILLAQVNPDDKTARRKAFLIDLDFAIRENDITKGDKAGTPPYMAIELLLIGDTRHERHHDLESLLYVFCNICISCGGPNNVKRTDFDLSKLYDWRLGPPDCQRDIGSNKVESFFFRSNFGEDVLANFHPYFWDLFKCAVNLRDVFYGDEEWEEWNIIGEATHDEVRNVFRMALDALCEDEEKRNIGAECVEELVRKVMLQEDTAEEESDGGPGGEDGNVFTQTLEVAAVETVTEKQSLSGHPASISVGSPESPPCDKAE